MTVTSMYFIYIYEILKEQIYSAVTRGRILNLERAIKDYIEMFTFSIMKVLPLFYSNLLIVLGHDKSKALTVLHKGLGLQLCDGQCQREVSCFLPHRFIWESFFWFVCFCFNFCFVLPVISQKWQYLLLFYVRSLDQTRF